MHIMAWQESRMLLHRIWANQIIMKLSQIDLWKYVTLLIASSMLCLVYFFRIPIFDIRFSTEFSGAIFVAAYDATAMKNFNLLWASACSGSMLLSISNIFSAFYMTFCLFKPFPRQTKFRHNFHGGGKCRDRCKLLSTHTFLVLLSNRL